MLPEYHPMAFPGLEPVAIPEEWADADVPRYVDAMIDEATDRAWELEEMRAGGAFIASDYRFAYQVLAELLRAGQVERGASWLEWGSGQGMATVLASMMGLQATGVEIDLDLVREARALAARYDVPGARFVHGSYREAEAKLPVLTAAGRDIVYVYPWPGEEAFFLRLFEETAAPGALLLVATGPLQISGFRRK